MAQLIVRELDDDVRDRLRERAKLHGRSMEAEAREILRSAVMSGSNGPGPGLGTRISRLFAEDGLDEAGIDGFGRDARPATFDG